MANLFSVLRAREVRNFSQPPFWSYDDIRSNYLSWASLKPNEERVEPDFEGYVNGLYKADGIVFSCVLARQQVLSQVRFKWRDFVQGDPGKLFGNQELRLLERPWPSGTTGELLARMDVDVSTAGNSFWSTADEQGRFGKAAAGPTKRVVHMRPDWVTIVIGSNSGNPYALDARIIAYRYEARTPDGQRAEPVLLLPSEVAHYSPIPDPVARFRGMSWLTPIVREVQSDKAATLHKKKFFEQGAVFSTILGLKDVTSEQFDEFVADFKEAHQGVENSWKTLFLLGGVDPTIVTADFKQLDLKAVQGGLETRIAAASGVHPVIAGFSEGMQGSSLNSGNFNATKRLYSEKTLRHLWAVSCASLQTLVKPPSDSAELWYEDSGVAFLREDAKDAAEIKSVEAQTLRTLIDAGYTADSAATALAAGDWSLLKHTGLFSVQLNPPNSGEAPMEDTDDEDAA